MSMVYEVSRKGREIDSIHNSIFAEKRLLYHEMQNIDIWWKGTSSQILTNEYDIIDSQINYLLHKIDDMKDRYQKLSNNIQRAEDEQRRKAELRRKAEREKALEMSKGY